MYELRKQQRCAAALAIFPSFSPSPTNAQTNTDYQIALCLALQDKEEQADPLPAPNTVASTASASSSSERKGKKRTIPADDDNKIEVVSYHRVIKVEPETPPRQVKRPRLTVQIPATPSTSSLPSSSSSVPALSASYSTASCDSIPSPGSSVDFPFYITSKDSDM
ncbi:hypothetical protein B0H17DRAFT_1152726 [Mycena rosella]|uniref:Uncharacterized protein n=1 Tax=Mycena rosella TaxID=1033263 RepID=A0AAD7BB95_MYCRO|nr:hypothetical protein B0H17DRAFT_1152726 [Mycena rosella]